MKEYRFNKEKDELLIRQRGVGFEVVIKIIKNDKKVKAIEHPNKKRYPKQKIFLVKIKNKIYAVPFIEENDYFFLKTIYPSEKFTKKLLKIKKKYEKK